MNNKIVQVVVGLPLVGTFDYALGPDLVGKVTVGSRVYVPFRQKRLVGYVVAIPASSEFPNIKNVLAVLDDDAPSLHGRMMAFTKKFADYYACSWGEAIETSLPVALRKKKILSLALPANGAAKAHEFRRVLALGPASPESWAFVVGKIKKARAEGRAVIYLVPETTLIEKVRAALKKECGEEVAVWERELSARKELAEWVAMKTGKAQIVVGTRSAVFAPFSRVGLIVIQDEDDLSYKQEQSPFYHARQVAQMRAEEDGAALLFVTPAPSAELYFDCTEKPAAIERFSAPKPSDFQIINLADFKPSSKMVVSFPMQNAIFATLAKKGKIVLFLNRRGFSLGTRCNQCGFTVKCARCNVTLSYLYSKKKLVCHLCQYATDLPQFCPHCKGSYLRPWGAGGEKIESELARSFPEAKTARYDRDTKEFPDGADIVVATQAVLRVLEDKAVDLIGVLEFDAELNRFDFRAGQRAFALLVRLRQLAKTKVLVQTREPYNYSLQAAAKMDFEKFYQEELAAREAAGFPPFKHLLEIVLRSATEMAAFDQAKILSAALQAAHLDKQHDQRALARGSIAVLDRGVAKATANGQVAPDRASLDGEIEIMAPQPAHQAKLRDQYRFVVMVKAPAVEDALAKILPIIRTLKKKKNVIITVNVDP